jgi:hypothetical protein
MRRSSRIQTIEHGDRDIRTAYPLPRLSTKVDLIHSPNPRTRIDLLTNENHKKKS